MWLPNNQVSNHQTCNTLADNARPTLEVLCSKTLRYHLRGFITRKVPTPAAFSDHDSCHWLLYFLEHAPSIRPAGHAGKPNTSLHSVAWLCNCHHPNQPNKPKTLATVRFLLKLRVTILAAQAYGPADRSNGRPMYLSWLPFHFPRDFCQRR